MVQAVAMSRVFEPPLDAVTEAVARALAEDLTPLGDLTSRLLPPDATAVASFVARQPGVLAGRLCADETFVQVDPEVELRWFAADGDALEPGQVIGEVSGALTTVLTAERTALNFLGHLSGIATLVRTYVEAAAVGGPARVWDTRKTTPGLRALEKAAVRAGGGRNHRGNLSEWLMFKDNHLFGTTITDAVARARDQWPGRTIEVEADRLDQVEEATRAGADAILLDNMTPDEIRRCVAAVEAIVGTGRRPLLEASGGIDLDTIASYAGTGVDMISVGRLTNSAPVLDIGLDVII
jgi:nicotinate-nucleotide pyrophosphorylase (carboxylating)